MFTSIIKELLGIRITKSNELHLTLSWWWILSS